MLSKNTETQTNFLSMQLETSDDKIKPYADNKMYNSCNIFKKHGVSEKGLWKHRWRCQSEAKQCFREGNSSLNINPAQHSDFNCNIYPNVNPTNDSLNLKQCEGSRTEAEPGVSRNSEHDQCKFVCKICNKILISMNQLMVHNKLNHLHKKKCYYHCCTLCNAHYRNRYSLIAHMRSIHFNMKSDTVTNKGIAQQSTIAKVIADEKTESICDIFRKKLSKRSLLTNKEFLEATEKPYFFCLHCGMRYAHKYRLKNHIKRHHFNANSIECPLCKEIFSNVDTFVQHILTVHTSNLQLFRCKECNVPFYSANFLEDHLRLEHKVVVRTCEIKHSVGKSDFKLDCPYCKSPSFNSLICLKDHVHSSHPGKPPFKCSLCSGVFYSGSQPLREHYLIMHGSLASYYKSESRRDINVDLAVGNSVESAGNQVFPEINETTSLKSGEKHSLFDSGLGNTALASHVNKNKRISAHFNNSRHECPICKKSFSRPRALEVHRFVHSDDRPVRCPHCTRSFKNKMSLRSHCISLHSEHMVGSKRHYPCSICGLVFNARVKVECHALDKHPGAKIFACDKCDENFTRHDDRYAHQLVRHGGGTCNVCGKQYKSYVSFTQHKRSHFVSLLCSICGKKYSSLSKYKRHLQMIHTDERHYLCNHCGSTFRHQEKLKQHQDICPMHRCKICHNLVPSIQELNVHMKEHGKGSILQCSTCGKLFMTKQRFRAHVRRCPISSTYVGHTQHAVDISDNCESELNVIVREKKRHHCEVCNKEYQTAGVLRLHKLMHAGVRFRCNQCHKTYSDRSTLAEHKRLHDETNQRTCDLCGKRFGTKGRLRQHKAYLHGIRPKHICTICGQEFSRASSLRIHKSVHADIREYSCDICQRRLVTAEELQKHIEAHISVSDTTHAVDAQADDATQVAFAQPDVIMSVHSECSVVGLPLKRTCHQSRIKLSTLIAHKAKLGSDMQKPSDCSTIGSYSCSVCSKFFKFMHELKYHVDTQHVLHQYKCRMCNAQFDKAKEFLQHKLNHSSEIVLGDPDVPAASDIKCSPQCCSQEEPMFDNEMLFDIGMIKKELDYNDVEFGKMNKEFDCVHNLPTADYPCGRIDSCNDRYSATDDIDYPNLSNSRILQTSDEIKTNITVPVGYTVSAVNGCLPASHSTQSTVVTATKHLVQQNLPAYDVLWTLQNVADERQDQVSANTQCRNIPINTRDNLSDTDSERTEDCNYGIAIKNDIMTFTEDSHDDDMDLSVIVTVNIPKSRWRKTGSIYIKDGLVPRIECERCDGLNAAVRSCRTDVSIELSSLDVLCTDGLLSESTPTLPVRAFSLRTKPQNMRLEEVVSRIDTSDDSKSTSHANSLRLGPIHNIDQLKPVESFNDKSDDVESTPCLITSEKKRHHCEVCMKGYRTAAVLRLHRLIHADVRFACDQCDKTYSDRSSIREHKKSHDSSNLIICDTCGKTFWTKARLRNHKALHIVRPKFVCAVCGQEFLRATSLQVHEFVHMGIHKYFCDFCKKGFATAGQLKRHVTKHFEQPKLICSECGKQFKSKDSLQTHRRFMHSTNQFKRQKSHICTVCGRAFSCASRLRDHITIHDDGVEFPCNLCNKTFRQSSKLKRHVSETHKDNRVRDRKSYPGSSLYGSGATCNTCGKSFVTHQVLKRHMRLHTNERPYKCINCERTFIQLSSYNSHLLNIHGLTKKRHPVSDTGVSQERNNGMENDVGDNLVVGTNVRTKLSDPPYICGLCGESFDGVLSYCQHLSNKICSKKLRAVGSSLFICAICNKHMDKVIKLVYHVRSHSGERPYLCVKCGRRFIQLAHYQTHQRSVRGCDRVRDK